ncbi:MAG: septal ring lytic transglycosylase RlpA family protein [Methylobacterium mesophilicum]|nr:septal ring lytic transglycosylase RlpA family protein [Methylobacterium mesophilicum]
MRQRSGVSALGVGKVTALAISATLLASCTSTAPKVASNKKRSKEYFAESVYGVKASPRVSNLRSRLPRGGGRDQTGQPYQVKGRWYFPKEEKGYRQVGQASWYGDAFHGRLTANGEVYDMTHLTAAHPTMPLPSYARVTNLANGNSIIVRVNDRGPYEQGRVIDLSRRAAELLDYAQAGSAKVQVEYVGRARMDGQDEQYLMASYRPGGRVPDPSADGLPSGVMIAMNGTQPSQPKARRAPMPKPLEPAEVHAAPVSMPASVDLPQAAPASDAPEAPASAPRRKPRREPEVKPGFAPPDQIPFAVMSYAPAGQADSGLSAFASFDRPTQHDYVAAGTFRSKREADALAERLADFGEARVEVAGGAFSVVLRSDGRLAGNDLLQAAWANGAPNAMTIR